MLSWLTNLTGGSLTRSCEPSNESSVVILIVNGPNLSQHISQDAARQPFRQTSVIRAVVDLTIAGAGGFGYRLGMQTANNESR